MTTLLWVLLHGLLVLLIAKIIPGIRVKSFGSAVVVAVVYGVLSWLLKGLLTFLSIPLIILTLGLFMLVINGFLLWLTDRILHSIEIKGMPALAMGTIALTVGSTLIHWILY